MSCVKHFNRLRLEKLNGICVKSHSVIFYACHMGKIVSRNEKKVEFEYWNPNETYSWVIMTAEFKMREQAESFAEWGNLAWRQYPFTEKVQSFTDEKIYRD